LDETQPRDAILHDKDGCDLSVPLYGGGGYPQETPRCPREEHTRKRSRARCDRGRECDLDGERALIGINGSGHLSDYAFDDPAAGGSRRHLVDRDLHALARVHVHGTRFIHAHHDLTRTARFNP
jgi:hypothetical protein